MVDDCLDPKLLCEQEIGQLPYAVGSLGGFHCAEVVKKGYFGNFGLAE